MTAMDSDPQRVYGKTAAGRQALTSRTSMTAKARMALIVINGKDDMRAVSASLGPGSAAVIDELLRAGLIELLSQAPAPAPAPPAPAPTVATAQTPGAPSMQPAGEADSRAKLIALQRQAVACLRPHFGPDVVVIAQALVSATSLQAFTAGLDAVERQLAVYVGKKQAARILAPLRV
jgi:hypothetical protein